MAYSCEFQNEVQSAFWSRGSVNLFTAATMYKVQTNTYLICTDCKNKDKNAIFVFVDYLYEKFIMKGEDVSDVVETI